MEKLIFRLLFLLTTINSYGQVITTYTRLSRPCVYDYPRDTLEYTCCNDTLCLTLGQAGQPCALLKTTIKVIADTLKIDIVDTSDINCWEACVLKMKYRVWALPHSYYIAKYRGEYYPIYCWSSIGLKEKDSFPSIKISDLLLTIEIIKPAQINLVDITGKLLLTTQDKCIDLKKMHLQTGIYILQIISADKNMQRKIVIE